LDHEIVRETLNVLLKFERDIVAWSQDGEYLARAAEAAGSDGHGRAVMQRLEDFLRPSAPWRSRSRRRGHRRPTWRWRGRYGSRELLKDALCVTLAKSQDEVDRFDLCFDTFFTAEEFKRALTPPEKLGADRRTTRNRPMKAARRGPDRSQMLLSNDAIGLAQAMEAAADPAAPGTSGSTPSAAC